MYTYTYIYSHNLLLESYLLISDLAHEGNRGDRNHNLQGSQYFSEKAGNDDPKTWSDPVSHYFPIDQMW